MSNQSVVPDVERRFAADAVFRSKAESEGLAAKAAQLYDAECALHAAQQSHVDAWIAAAAERLHDAVVDYYDAF